MRTEKLLVVVLLLALAASCSLSPRKAGPPAEPSADMILPETARTVTTEPAEPGPVKSAALVPATWEDVEGWEQDNPEYALDAFLKSCSAVGQRQEWQEVCAEAALLAGQEVPDVRGFFERFFTPYQLTDTNHDPVGLATGYYIPDLRGSRHWSPAYPYPLYRRPADLLVVDLSTVYPELSGYRLRGRLDEQRVLPYWDRAQIEGSRSPLQGQELLWVDDPVELFFLHIQGSGRILFEDGSWSMVNYAGQNGHPYRSISKWLLARDIMPPEKMSMQSIRAWARDNPSQVRDLLNTNPSYVFFRELPGDAESPPGALGVPLTPGRSVAVDPRYIPLGAPVFLATTWPNTNRPLFRLMMAQDTGGAINGPVRADFFWGMGDAAGMEAGRMKQPLWMWVLLPEKRF